MSRILVTAAFLALVLCLVAVLLSTLMDAVDGHEPSAYHPLDESAFVTLTPRYAGAGEPGAMRPVPERTERPASAATVVEVLVTDGPSSEGAETAGSPVTLTPRPAQVIPADGQDPLSTRVPWGSRNVTPSVEPDPGRTGAPVVTAGRLSVQPEPRATDAAVSGEDQTPGTAQPSPVIARAVPWIAATGIASWMPAGYGANYLALPHGPGFRVVICGPGGCRAMVSTDAGPSLAMQRGGRIADIGVVAWEAICGVPRRYGLCQVSVALGGE